MLPVGSMFALRSHVHIRCVCVYPWIMHPLFWKTFKSRMVTQAGTEGTKVCESLLGRLEVKPALCERLTAECFNNCIQITGAGVWIAFNPGLLHASWQ